MSRRRAKALPKGKDEDVRTMAGLITAGIISLVVVISVILAPIPQVGPDEGNQAPDFVADSYNGASWSEYRLSDNYDWDWNGSSDSKWFLIYFMDTDCPYCWVDGDEMSQLHSQWSDRVNFVTIAAELSIPDHDSTREEIEAFRDKTSYFGCNSDRDDCTSLNLRFKSGATGHLSCIAVTANYWRFHVAGSKGWAEMRDETTLATCNLRQKPEITEFGYVDIEKADPVTWQCFE